MRPPPGPPSLRKSMYKTSIQSCSKGSQLGSQQAKSWAKLIYNSFDKNQLNVSEAPLKCFKNFYKNEMLNAMSNEGDIPKVVMWNCANFSFKKSYKQWKSILPKGEKEVLKTEFMEKQEYTQSGYTGWKKIFDMHEQLQKEDGSLYSVVKEIRNKYSMCFAKCDKVKANCLAKIDKDIMLKKFNVESINEKEDCKKINKYESNQDEFCGPSHNKSVCETGYCNHIGICSPSDNAKLDSNEAWSHGEYNSNNEKYKDCFIEIKDDIETHCDTQYQRCNNYITDGYKVKDENIHCSDASQVLMEAFKLVKLDQ